MRQSVFYEKLLTLGLTLLMVWALPWEKLVLAYILMGHGHFLIAYYYQYKAGKMTQNFVVSYLGWFVLLSLWYFTRPDFRLLSFVTVVCFLIHMSLDELYLTRFPINLRSSPLHLGRTLELLPFVLIFLGISLEGVYPQAPIAWYYTPWLDKLIMVSLWLLWPYFYLIRRGHHRFDGKSLYFLAGALALICLAKHESFAHTAAAKFYGFIIIYHYISWYIHFYLNIPDVATKLTFLKRVAGFNGIVLIAYAFRSGTFLEKWVFGIECYYLWAMLHILSSTRASDISALFRLKPRP